MYKIYKIVDNTNGNVYIGQTKQKYLSNRIAHHRNNYKYDKQCSSKNILCNDDWYYELIEETNDLSREKYWIHNTSNCINKSDFEKYETYEKKRGKKPERILYQKNRLKNRYEFYKLWGGDPRSNNNLLLIDVNIFLK